MEGVLMWKSCTLLTTFYNTFAGPYKLAIDGKQRKFTLEKSPLRLAQFYVSLIPMLLTLLGCGLRILDPSLANQNSVQVSVISCIEAGITLACITVNILVILFGAELVDIMNHSYILVKDTTNPSNSQKDQKNVLYLFLREFLKALFGRHYDNVGMVIFTIHMFAIGNAFTFPMAMTSNLDPMFSITERLLDDWNPKLKIAVRYILNQWAMFHCSRPLIVCVTCSLAFVASSKSVITSIIKRALSLDSILLYSRLQLLATIGQDVIKHLSAVYMTLAFSSLVFINFVMINCFHSMPLPLYFCVATVAVAFYLCLNILVPQIVYCNEITKHLLSTLWRREHILLRGKLLRKESTILAKTLKAQRPIKYYYGIAVFDQETKSNYYRNILDYTINILLVN